MKKTYTLEVTAHHRNGTRTFRTKDTLAGFIKAYAHTLDLGYRWGREDGGFRVDTAPESANDLVFTLNNAAANIAKHGCELYEYTLVNTPA